LNQLKQLLRKGPLSGDLLREITPILAAKIDEMDPHAWFYAICLHSFRDLLAFPPYQEADIADSALEELASEVLAGQEAIEEGQSAEVMRKANAIIHLTRGLTSLS
jgi:hypothetical protein